MNESAEVDLKSLVGEHMLSGLDRDEYVGSWGDKGEILRFVLDRRSYEAMEDPSDGYRSCLQSLKTVETPVQNTFPETRVVIRFEEKGRYGAEAEILAITAVENGKDVLLIGTDNSDDYYPSFVGEFTPENLPCNDRSAS